LSKHCCKALVSYLAVGEGTGKITTTKLPEPAKSAYEKCDALDGLKDGVIENPLGCNFDPARDLEKCPERKRRIVSLRRRSPR
jgi:hypothetical protein